MRSVAQLFDPLSRKWLCIYLHYGISKIPCFELEENECIMSHMLNLYLSASDQQSTKDFLNNFDISSIALLKFSICSTKPSNSKRANITTSSLKRTQLQVILGLQNAVASYSM